MIFIQIRTRRAGIFPRVGAASGVLSTFVAACWIFQIRTRRGISFHVWAQPRVFYTRVYAARDIYPDTYDALGIFRRLYAASGTPRVFYPSLYAACDLYLDAYAASDLFESGRRGAKQFQSRAKFIQIRTRRREIYPRTYAASGYLSTHVRGVGFSRV